MYVLKHIYIFKSAQVLVSKIYKYTKECYTEVFRETVLVC